MIKHGMDVQKWAIQYLNPGQIPVTTFDQPLFALAKLVQWKWPESHGEAKHVVMLRGGGGGGGGVSIRKWLYGIHLETCWKVLVGLQLLQRLK